MKVVAFNGSARRGANTAILLGYVLGELKKEASEAREALERELTKQTGHTGPNAGRVMNDSSVTFGWFVRNRFFPLKEAHWKEETAKVKKLLIQRDLIDPFDKTPLRNFDKFTLQVHLNNLAKTNSKDRVLQIRASSGTSLQRRSTRTSSSRTRLERSPSQLSCPTLIGRP